jgi:hypothetical protein
MSESVEYKVSTVFEATDKASSKIKDIDESAKSATKATITFGEALKGLAVAGLGMKVFEIGKSALFGMNNELSKSTAAIAALTRMHSDASMDTIWSRAEKSMARFNEMSWKSAVPVDKIFMTMKELQVPLLQAGMRFSEIEELAHSAADIAGPLGKTEEAVAESIQKAIITGRVKKDMFMRSLLMQGEIGIDSEAFEKMGHVDRSEVIRRALNTRAISDFKDREGNTFDAAGGDIQSHISKLATSATKPLFNEFTNQLIEIRSWIESNRSTLESMAKSVGSGLVEGFSAAKGMIAQMWPVLKEMGSVVGSLISFAANHKDALIALAQSLLVLKVGEKIGNLARGGFSSITGMGNPFGALGGGIGDIRKSLGDMRTGATGVGSGLMTLIPAIGTVASQFTLLAGAGYTLYRMFSAETEETKRQRDVAQGQAVEAGKFKALVDERNALKNKFSALGFDDTKEITDPVLSADRDRLKQLEADYAATASSLVKEAMKTGLVTERTDQFGRRQLAMWNAGAQATPDNASEVNKAHASTREALKLYFEEQYIRMQGWKNPLHPDYVGGSGSVGTGAYKGAASDALLYAFSEAVLQLKKSDDDDIQVKPVKQTVNITIQKMMAKDPHRWLAEVDDMVSKHQRSPTRAKDSWRSSSR